MTQVPSEVHTIGYQCYVNRVRRKLGPDKKCGKKEIYLLQVSSLSCYSCVYKVFGYLPPYCITTCEMIKFPANLRETTQRLAVQIRQDEVQDIIWQLKYTHISSPFEC